MKLLLLSFLLLAPPVCRAQTAPDGAAPAATAHYRGQSFPRQRTPVAQLPLDGQAEIMRLETLLEQAGHQAAAVAPTWNQDAYRREAAFYAAEQARRQR